MDFLQQANHELEGKLQSSEEAGAELKQQVQELSSKNSRICSELQEIGDLVKQMEAEKQGNEDSLKSRVTQLEVRLFMQLCFLCTSVILKCGCRDIGLLPYVYHNGKGSITQSPHDDYRMETGNGTDHEPNRCTNSASTTKKNV